MIGRITVHQFRNILIVPGRYFSTSSNALNKSADVTSSSELAGDLTVDNGRHGIFDVDAEDFPIRFVAL